jgi:hypothetical protein
MLQIVAWYVSRGKIEVTFEEVRTYLGLETQRQWSMLAINRTTPCPARDCLVWWCSWPKPCILNTCQPGKRPGIPKPNPPVSMPLLLFVAICGLSGIRQPLLLLERLSIGPKSSLIRSLRSPVMLPKSAKVEKQTALANSRIPLRSWFAVLQSERSKPRDLRRS